VSTPEKQAELKSLLDRAQKGDQATLPALRELLANPAIVEELGGDLARQAQLTLIGKFSGKSLIFREALPRKLDLLRAELLGPNSTPLERLLVECVVTTWLHLHHLEMIYAGKDSMSLPLATHYERSLTAAQKRYLAAINADFRGAKKINLVLLPTPK
jgi:hypothetical protein